MPGNLNVCLFELAFSYESDVAKFRNGSHRLPCPPKFQGLPT